jgi:hypothetical protein
MFGFGVKPVGQDVRMCAGFSDAGIDKASQALVRPASDKRQARNRGG